MSFPGGKTSNVVDHVIGRPRLLEHFRDLERGGRIVALWAPAGAGKTILLRQWIDTLVESVEIVDCAEAAKAALALDDVNAGDRSYLILDNVDRATVAVRETVLQLIENGLGDAKIVLAGRFDPFPVSASRWVVTREIREADLIFTADEVAEYFGMPSANTDPVPQIVAVTDGWPVALGLLRQVAGDAEIGDVVSRFDGDVRPIAEYLVYELLNHLAAEQREILVWSAVARVVPTQLALHVVGRDDVDQVLDQLVRSNTLVARENDSYVFHPLLATFLRAEQRRTDAHRARRGHSRAAQWFAEHGDLLSALEQLGYAEDSTALSAFLEEHGYALIFRGASGAVMDAVRTLPLADRERLEADLRLVMDAPHFTDRDGTLRRLATRTAAHSDVMSPVDQVVDALWAYASGRTDAYIAAPDKTSDSPLSRDVQAFTDIATVWIHDEAHDGDGRLRKAERLIALGSRLGSSGTERWLRLLALESALSVVATAGLWVDVEAVFLSISRDLIVAPDTTDGVAARAAFAVAAQAYHRGEPISVRSLKPLIDADESPVESAMQHLARTLIALDRMERIPGPEALRALTAVMEDDLTDSVPSVAYAVVPWMVSAMWHGDSALADRILFRVRRVLRAESLESLVTAFVRRPSRESEIVLRLGIEESAPKVSPLTLTYAWVQLALYAEQRGQKAAATERALSALMSAAPLNAIRPFLQEGGQPAQLLRARIDRLGAWREFGEQVVAHGAVPGADSRGLPALTVKERELVRELPAHQSLADIAAERQVSINTVKSQLRSVYSKLGVASRADAVAVARELGLI